MTSVLYKANNVPKKNLINIQKLELSTYQVFNFENIITTQRILSRRHYMSYVHKLDF